MQGGEACFDLIDGVAHPEAEIGRDLIVARARGVESSGNRPDQFGQPRFGDHVNIFKVEIDGYAVRRIFGGDPIQTGADRCRILGRNDALLPQHGDMRLRSGDILLPQSLVEGDRGVYLAHD